MFPLISIFWFIRTAKAILFWVYLWQLKEYHIGRFLAHFSTAKGKNLLFNKLLFLKIVLLLVFLFSGAILPFTTGLFNIALLPVILLGIYLLESTKTVKDFFQKKIKKPVLTKKTGIILLFSFILFAFMPLFFWQQIQLYKFCFWLLLIDVLTPLIVSLIVLSFQPLSVSWRNKVIKRAKEKREQFKDLLVIGITGSYGKTSVKEFLYTILAEKFGQARVLKTKAHQNSEIGISQCILNDLKLEHEIFICEMGAYNRGGIKLLCDIAKPKIGILTGINEQHMATFGSQENIIKTKFELIENLPEEGIGILNGDCEYINPKSKIQMSYQIQNPNVKNIKFYSTKEKMDIWAEDVKMYREGIFFKVLDKLGDFAEFNVNLLGKQNVENILAAASCAKELEMTLGEISRACEKIKQMPGAGKLIKIPGKLNIIDATYSANPDGVLSHLDYLKIWPGKKIIVMPCLIELGKASKEVHRRIGERIADVCDLAIITTKECFENIEKSVLLDKFGGRKKCQVVFIEDPKKILKKIAEFCFFFEAATTQEGIGETILLEGRLPKEVLGGLLKMG